MNIWTPHIAHKINVIKSIPVASFWVNNFLLSKLLISSFPRAVTPLTDNIQAMDIIVIDGLYCKLLIDIVLPLCTFQTCWLFITLKLICDLQVNTCLRVVEHALFSRGSIIYCLCIEIVERSPPNPSLLSPVIHFQNATIKRHTYFRLLTMREFKDLYNLRMGR